MRSHPNLHDGSVRKFRGLTFDPYMATVPNKEGARPIDWQTATIDLSSNYVTTA